MVGQGIHCDWDPQASHKAWPTLDVLERWTVQRRITNNHVSRKGVTFPSPGFRPSPVPKPPERHAASSLSLSVSSPLQTPHSDEVSSPPLRPCFPFGMVIALTPPCSFRGRVASPGAWHAIRVYLLSTPTQSHTHLGVSSPGLTPVGLLPNLGRFQELSAGVHHVITRHPPPPDKPVLPRSGERNLDLVLGTVEIHRGP